ncbi:hypothetical protein [Tichowtungia aerotolerans]|uniref:Uncharacterized protein n=1 Tax=Tichowtungia aerotolerans TaxID=2697043 RepID=A0A6P1M7H8_9BACT|nr:hypothetical protein [Tichowtungia aerotolerans]QHI69003.1 hypothetical protein GT409_05930 [Tichowtungia aerotolerans]
MRIVLLVIIALFNSGCASMIVHEYGRQIEFKRASGIVCWENGDVGIQEQTINRCDGFITREPKIISTQYCLLTKNDLSIFNRETNSSGRVIIYLSPEFSKNSINNNSERATQTELALSKDSSQEVAGVTLAERNLTRPIPYPDKKSDVSISFEKARRYGRVKKRSIAGKIQHPILFLPALVTDVVLTPVYIIAVPVTIITQMGDV